MTSPHDPAGAAPHWPLHRYRFPLQRDRWFLFALLLYAVLVALNVWTHNWFGIVGGLVVFYFLGGVRNLWSSFSAGFRVD